MEPDIEKNLNSSSSNSNVKDFTEVKESSASEPTPNEVGSDNDTSERGITAMRKKFREHPPFSDRYYQALRETAASWSGVRPVDATEEALTLMTELIADTFVYKESKEYQVFRRFSWLNRINLLFYQHEVIAMEKRYSTDLSALMKPGERENFRKTLEAYSTPKLIQPSLADIVIRRQCVIEISKTPKNGTACVRRGGDGL